MKIEGGKKLTVECELTDEMLGSQNANPTLHQEFTASKSGDAEKMKEEMAALPAEVVEQKSRTVFYRTHDGSLCLKDYQVKGFFKEAIGVLLDAFPSTTPVKVGKTAVTKWTYKKIVDGFIFVTPRDIVLATTPSPDCVRPLRATTMQGDRVALACSETVPEGTKVMFTVTVFGDNEHLWELVRAALDYGVLKGLGQWRNSGKGRFGWKELGV